MHAVVYHGPCNVTVVDVPDPRVEQPLAAGIRLQRSDDPEGPEGPDSSSNATEGDDGVHGPISNRSR